MNAAHTNADMRKWPIKQDMHILSLWQQYESVSDEFE